MDRREFLSKLVQIITISSFSSFKLLNFLHELEAKELPHLVVVEGKNLKRKTLNDMLEKGIAEIGGIRKFVRRASKVVIHPNMSWSGLPQHAVNTNPNLVEELVKICFKAGAKEVRVIDHTVRAPAIALSRSGIKSAVKRAGGKVYAINNEGNFYKVRVRGAKVLRSVKIAKELRDCDLLINVPIAKVHSATRLTMCMKNLMGLVWDRKFFHATDLNQTIVDLNRAIKPHLNILDATRILLTGGPQGPGRTKRLNKIILGKSAVSVDAFGSTLFNLKPDEIPHLRIAKKEGLGEIDLKKLKIEYIRR